MEAVAIRVPLCGGAQPKSGVYYDHIHLWHVLAIVHVFRAELWGMINSYSKKRERCDP
jgi:hypothetical protein